VKTVDRREFVVEGICTGDIKQELIKKYGFGEQLWLLEAGKILPDETELGQLKEQ